MSKKLIAGAGVVASLAVALAPLATFATVVDGNTHRDTIKATIEPVCSFGHTLHTASADTDITIGSHVHGTDTEDDYDGINGTNNGRWSDEGNTPAATTTATNYITADSRQNHVWSGATATSAVGETLWGVVENSKSYDNFGQTILHVYCNVDAGYQITATPTAMTGDATQTAIPYGYTSGVATSKWGLKIAATTDRGAIVSGYDNFSPELNLPADSDTKTSVVLTNAAGRTTDTTGDEYTITYGMGISAVQEAGTYTGSVTYVLADL